MSKVTTTDCRSFDGVTVGLIDSIITAARVLKHRNQDADAVQEALKDLRSDTDVRHLLLQENTEQKKSDNAFYMGKLFTRLVETLGMDPESDTWFDIADRVEALAKLSKYPIAHPCDDFTGDNVYQYDSNLFVWYTRQGEQRIAKSLKLANAHRNSHMRITA